MKSLLLDWRKFIKKVSIETEVFDNNKIYQRPPFFTFFKKLYTNNVSSDTILKDIKNNNVYEN